MKPELMERSEHKFLAECDPALICPIEPDGKMRNDIEETPRFLCIETTGQISAGFNSDKNKLCRPDGLHNLCPH